MSINTNIFQTSPVTTTVNTNNNIITQDSFTATNVTQKQEPVEPLEIKPKINPLPPINPPNVPVISSSKLQPNHFDPNMPLNVSIRLPENLTDRKNLIKCNLENQLDVQDLKYNPDGIKFNPDGIKFNPDIKQEPINFPTQQDFKKESGIIKQECIPKVEIDSYGKY